MTRRFYNLINLLLGIMVFAGLLQTALRFMLGADLFRQKSFLTLFVFQMIVSLFMSVLALKYYWHKKYHFAFSTGMVSIVSSVVYALVVYSTLSTLQQHALYFPILIFHVLTTIALSISLIFPSAGNRYWLRIAGIYLLIVALPTVISIVYMLLDPSANTAATIEKFAPWVSLISSLCPIFFILNFIDEARHIERDTENPTKQESPLTVWQWLVVLLGIGVLTYGVKLSSDVYWSRHWSNHNFEQTKAMARRFEAHIYVNSKGDTLYYRLLKPLNYDTTKKYPLLVCLPYGGQPGTDKIRQLEGAAAAELFATEENRNKYPAFIFVPNCPAGSGWGGIPGYPSVDSLVYDAIVSLNKEPGIDVKRRYVTGISRGGYGAWNFISTRPDLFAAAAPVCGGGDPSRAANAVNVAVWAFHGEEDHNVPVGGSRDIISAIKKAGGHPKYTEFANEGHNIWYQTSITPGLWDWLFAQHQK